MIGVSEPPLPLSARVAGITGSIIDSSTSLLQRQKHDIVRFAMGSPAADALPTEAFRELSRSILGGEDSSPYDYGPTEGELGLRESLRAFLRQQRGEEVALERLLITAGGMQGLDLVCKLFVEAGDLVAVESPTYTNGIATITGYEGEVLEIPTDRDGMRVEVLERLCEERGSKPKLIYVIPNFQNPSGTTLSLARRERLVALAREWGAVILEDDPYHLLRFEGAALPSLEQLAGDSAQVIGVHTFSKILAPGLRVGWLTAEPRIITLMIAAKQSMDTCTNVPMQRVVAAFLDEGLMEAHLRRLRDLYRERKVGMQAALAEGLGEADARWTDPQGGFFLWLELEDRIDTEQLFPLAVAEGVAFIPGNAFSLDGEFGNALRLCFASTDPERTHTGIQRLRRAIDKLTKEST